MQKLELSERKKKQAILFYLEGQIAAQRFHWRKRLQQVDLTIPRNSWEQRMVYLCEHKAPRFVDVVKELYSNMLGMKDKIVYFRNEWIFFSREEIDKAYNLNERKNGSKFKKLVKEPDFQKIVDFFIDGKGK